MSAPSKLEVTVAVERADGTLEQVRVGTAYRDGEALCISLGELRVGQARPGTSASTCAHDLEYYAERARKRLADPGKSRWHEADRRTLAEIERMETELADRTHTPAKHEELSCPKAS